MFDEKYKLFLDNFLKRVEDAGLDVSLLYMDHLGYKTATEEEYWELKPEFLKKGECVRETVVRERRVGVFKLANPLHYRQYVIPAVELIAPKKGETAHSGYEHAEFVLDEGYDTFLKKYPKQDWDLSVMAATEFSMIKLKLGEDMQIKLHLEPILQIIENLAGRNGESG